MVLHQYRVIPLSNVRENPRNARTHSKKQIASIANSIRAAGFASPILVDEQNVLLAGHGRFEAAKLLGLDKIPAIVVEGLTEARKRALTLADNRIAQSAGWDRDKLVSELLELPEILEVDGLDISVTGFEQAEIDGLIEDLGDEAGGEDAAPEVQAHAVTKTGDLWVLGKHRLLCGDARKPDDLKRLLNGELAAAAFLDPPYNVKIAGVVGRGSTKHREFAMASGEMSPSEFVRFLEESLSVASKYSRDGAVHYVCMDWRHIAELVRAGQTSYGDLLNIVAWVKSNAGQGSFYRSQHELIGVFRVGKAAHQNNIELGRHGRSRSNVWKYAGANTFRQGRMDDLRDHPTVKPTALIADALKDCTRRGEVVLDTFCGSGSTLLAAEKVGRCGRGIEIDPRYVDVAIRRWQAFTGKDAVHETGGATFDTRATQADIAQ